jgi:prepilin-type N-terminal cleavage/methylation domain-containing protein
MKGLQPGGRQRGFTLIEMLVVLAIMVVVLTLAVPSLLTTMRQGKLRGAAGDTVTLMRLARLEAIKRSCPTLVRVVPAAGRDPERVEGIVDCDSNGIQDANAAPLGSIPLPAQVHLLAPPDLAGASSVLGFCPDPKDPATNAAIFNGNGSVCAVRAVSGFHFGDDAGNFLEVRVAPAATARIEVRKCKLCTDAASVTDWYAAGDGGGAWTWK